MSQQAGDDEKKDQFSDEPKGPQSPYPESPVLKKAKKSEVSSELEGHSGACDVHQKLEEVNAETPTSPVNVTAKDFGTKFGTASRIIKSKMKESVKNTTPPMYFEKRYKKKKSTVRCKAWRDARLELKTNAAGDSDDDDSSSSSFSFLTFSDPSGSSDSDGSSSSKEGVYEVISN